MYLKQQLAAVFDQLKAKDTQLTALHHQLQAQHTQQAQRAQHAQQAQRRQQLDQVQHSMHDFSQAPAQEASEEPAAGDAISYLRPSQRFASDQTSPVIPPVDSSMLPALLETSGASGLMQLQEQTVITDCMELPEFADRRTPRHQFVKQRVQELQSRQSSPEKPLSSVSSRLNSPRAGLLGSTSRAGLLDVALDSSTPAATGFGHDRVGQLNGADGISPGRQGHLSSADSTTAEKAVTATLSSIAGQRHKAQEWDISGTSNQQDDPNLHSSPRAYDNGMTLQQQEHRITHGSGDRADASSSADEQSRLSLPSQDWGRNQIGPQYASAQISPSSLQLQSEHAQPAGTEASDPLPWFGALEVGSPGLELPCEEASDPGSAPGDKDAPGEQAVAAPQGRTGAAVVKEDSAQFGPEASAMSLPGRACRSEVDV